MKPDFLIQLQFKLEPIISMVRPMALGIMIVLILATFERDSFDDYGSLEFTYWNE